MTQYVFDPDDLQRIVKMHLDVPLDQRFDRIAQTLREVYGEHVHLGGEWIWSNAGGIMCSMSVLHTSPKEYLLFCGTAVGSEGHSGRHRADLYDIVVHGELKTFKTDQFRPTGLEPGDMSYLPRKSTNGSHLAPECWLLEYARGNIPSMFPFALGDTVFSTQDLTDLAKTMKHSTRLMAAEARLALKRRFGKAAPLRPRRELIHEPAHAAAAAPKGDPSFN